MPALNNKKGNELARVDDEYLFESEAIGKGTRNHRNEIRDQEEPALDSPELIRAVSQVRQIDPETKVDTVVGKPLEDLDPVRDPKNGWK